MTIKGLSALNAELSSAPALHIEMLTGEELNAVAGGEFRDSELGDGCTCNTRSFCSTDGVSDGDPAN